MSTQQRRGLLTGLILVNAVILGVFTWAGGLKDLTELWDDSRRTQLSIVLTPDKQVRNGQLISLDYNAPTSGYLSLWNWNSRGEIKNIVPVYALNMDNYHQKFTVRADTVSGMEQIIMLWTPQNPNHPLRNYYPNDAAFSGVVRILPDVEKRSAQVYVYDQLSVNTF